MIRTINLPKLILLQGPPGCGKDTIAHLLRDFGGYTHFKFAQPIIDAMQGQFTSYFEPSGRPKRTIDEFKRHDFGKYLCGDGRTITGRDIMIAWSEQYMKPLFGQDVFGTLADNAVFPRYMDREADPTFRAVMSDSGFEPESRGLFTTIKHENAAIIQIYRPGKTYAGDSRNYWAMPAVATFSYNNALEGLDEMQKDFIRFFNTSVYSHSDLAKIRSPGHEHTSLI